MVPYVAYDSVRPLLVDLAPRVMPDRPCPCRYDALEHAAEDYQAGGIDVLDLDRTDTCSPDCREPDRDVSFHFYV